jgi:GMP synthase-like glutamine amidotransferase
MRVHILQHVPFEGIGSMAAWLENVRAEVSYTRFFHNAALPRLSDLDLVIIMGGPMSINDEQVFSWLRAEKEFIRNAVKSGVSVLGVCLGAQLIVSALGARVYKNPQKEIGWFPVESVNRGMGAFVFPDRSTVFHWHGETFDLPKGAVWLARSEACENQAFQIGQKVIGLQFHLESTPESVEALLNNCGDELTHGRYIQNESEIRKANNEAYAKVNNIMDDLLKYLTGN